MTIRIKLALSLCIAMLLVCFMGTVFFKARSLERATRHELEEASKTVAHLQDLIEGLEKQFARADYFLVTLDAKEESEFRSLKRSNAAKLELIGWIPFERDLLNATTTAESLFNLQKDRHTRSISTLIADNYAATTRQLRQNMRQHLTLVIEESHKRQALAQSKLKRLDTTFSMLLLLGALSLVAVNLFIYRSIASPLAIIHDGIVRLGSGIKDDAMIKLNSLDEFGQLAAAFNSMVHKLQELEKLKQDFVSSATHELRSPLSAGQSFVTLLLEDISKKKSGEPLSLQDVERWRNFLGRLKSNLDRLHAFISDMLEMSKIERGKLECNISKMDLRPIIEETVEFFRAKAKEKQITIGAELPVTSASCLADSERIRQIAVNLIDNAIKFTRRGGNIKVSLSKDDADALRVSVSDEGPGIPPADRQRVFNKFEHVKDAYKFAEGAKGTGLGLSICKAIIEAHKGKIWVDGVKGREGARFNFTLPVAQEKG
ncbi:MAG: HAMP domain-containing sensor histidine kinase [Elusimicrobiota bacterium]